MNKNIQKEVEQILQGSLKKERVNTTPFFTTRVMGKVEQIEDNGVLLNKMWLILRPALAMLIIVNVVNFFIYWNKDNNQTDSSSNIELAVNDYSAWNNEFVYSDDILSNN